MIKQYPFYVVYDLFDPFDLNDWDEQVQGFTTASAAYTLADILESKQEYGIIRNVRVMCHDELNDRQLMTLFINELEKTSTEDLIQIFTNTTEPAERA